MQQNIFKEERLIFIIFLKLHLKKNLVQGPLLSLSDSPSLVTGHRKHPSMDSGSRVCLSFSHFLWCWGLNLERWACRVKTWPLSRPSSPIVIVFPCLPLHLPFLCPLCMRSYTFSFPISCMAFWSFCGIGVVSSNGEREGSQCQFSRKAESTQTWKAHRHKDTHVSWLQDVTEFLQRISFESFEHFYGAGIEQVYP